MNELSISYITKEHGLENNTNKIFKPRKKSIAGTISIVIRQAAQYQKKHFDNGR